ncbi:MAG: S8 family serine peptidase, partial [archaeon]
MKKGIVMLSLVITLIFLNNTVFALQKDSINKIDSSLNSYLENYTGEKNIPPVSKNIFSANSMNNNVIQKIPVIIKLSDNASMTDVYNFLQQQGAEIKYSFQLINSIAAEVSFNTIEILANDKDVKRIYLDREIYLEPINQTQEKDIYENLESNSYKRPYEENSYLPLLNESTTYINAPYLWDLGLDGEGVKIAILDTGIDESHPDLSGKVIASRDFTLFDNELKTGDGYGHGTHVAGTVAGTGIASIKVTDTSSTDTSGLVNLPYFPNIYHVGYEELQIGQGEVPDFYNILAVKNIPSEGEVYLPGAWPDNDFDFETNSITNYWREYDFSFDNSTQKLYGGYWYRSVLDLGEISMDIAICPEKEDYYDNYYAYNSSENVYLNHTYCIYTSKGNYVKIKILENNSDYIRFNYKWQSPEPPMIILDKDGNFNTKADQYFASNENHLHKTEKTCYSSGYCYYSTSPLMIYNLSSDLNTFRILIDFNGDNIPDYMRGVAPGASLLNAKVLSDYGGGYDSGIIAGIEWAVTNKADIISLSLGGWENICDGNDPLSEAVEKASDLNVTVVIAAGNSGGWGRETLGSPGCADKIITVGAISKDYYYNAEIAYFSSQGPSADGRIKPEILAPGVGIIAPQAKDTSMGYSLLNGYTSASGTSMATPHVSGAIALLKQADPSLTPKEIKEILMSTSRDMKGESVFRQGAGIIDLYYAYHYSYSPKVSPSVLNLIMNNKETKSIDLENSYYDNLRALPYKDELNEFTDYFNGEVDQTNKFYYNFTIPKDTQTFTVYINWTNKSNDVDMKLRTPSGYYYYSAWGWTDYEEITLENPEPGDYGLEVYPWWVQEEVEVEGILTYKNLIEWNWFNYNSSSKKLEIKSDVDESGLYAGKLFLVDDWNWTYSMVPVSIILSEYLEFGGEINHSYFINPCESQGSDDKITWNNFGSSEESYASFDDYFCEDLSRKAYSFEISEDIPYFDIFLNWWTPSNSYYEDLRIFIYNPEGELYDSIDYSGEYESTRVYYPSSGNWTLVVESEYAGDNGVIFSGEISIPSIILSPS